MKVFTPKTLAATALERWRRQYGDNNLALKHLVSDRLEALGPAPAPEQVNEVIGNDGWTRMTCDECGNDNPPVVVQLGQEPDYESRTANVCLECLRKAVTAAEKSNGAY